MTSPQSPAAAPARTWTPAQRFAVVFGVVYFLVGAAGFVVTRGHDFAGMDHGTLLIFAVNPLHNIIHLAIGIAWLVCAARHRAARAANLVVGIVLGLVTVLGFVDGMGVLGMSGLGDPDNFLHLATATLSLYFGSVAAGTPEATATTPGAATHG